MLPRRVRPAAAAEELQGRRHLHFPKNMIRLRKNAKEGIYMILAIDTGNTNIVLGCLEQGRILFTLRLQTDRNKTADEYALLLEGLLRRQGVEPKELEGGILSTVVPELGAVLLAALGQITGKEFLLVGPSLDTGLDIRTDQPAQLGADLVVDAVAALAKYRPPIAVFDMGTATTLSVLGKDGAYLGGMIIPGLRLSVDALSGRAAQLPYIHLGAPTALVGKNTVDCMRAGAVYGAAAMLDGLIDRVQEEFSCPLTSVATGGLTSVVLPYCRREIHHDPDLLLEGLDLLYQRNRTKPR